MSAGHPSFFQMAQKCYYWMVSRKDLPASVEEAVMQDRSSLSKAQGGGDPVDEGNNLQP